VLLAEVRSPNEEVAVEPLREAGSETIVAHGGAERPPIGRVARDIGTR